MKRKIIGILLGVCLTSAWVLPGFCEYGSIQAKESTAVEEFFDDTDIPVTVTKDGYAQFKIAKEDLKYTNQLYNALGWFDEESNWIYYFGNDINVNMDWNTGIAIDNFSRQWGGLNNHVAYMNVTYVDENMALYSVPIILNAEKGTLRVKYDRDLGKYEILGVRDGLNKDDGKGDTNLKKLKVGDKVSMVLYVAQLGKDSGKKAMAMPAFTLSRNFEFDDVSLSNGLYFGWFEVEDLMENYRCTQTIFFECDDEGVIVKL